MTIVAVPLSESIKHNVLEEGKAVPVPKFTQLCFDPLCDHRTVACPTMMRSPDAEFLVEATESNGDLPIIYYHRSTGESRGDGEMVSYGSEIIRFDVAQGKAKRVIFSDEPIKQLMAYGDYLYFTTLSDDDAMQINTVKKTGEAAQRLESGSVAINLIGANEQGAYFNDDKGNIYALDINGESFEKIYTLSEYYVLGHPGRGAAELNMLVYEDYLYYFADYKTAELPWGDSTTKFNDHSIRRVKLDVLDVPSEEGEMVAESVYDTQFYGIYDSVLYYAPFDVRTNIEESTGNHWSHSNGTINGVNLDTLENFTVISDCGFNLTANPYYINDRCIIGQINTYRNLECFSYDKYWCKMLLDFETGAIYPVEGDSALLTSQD